MSRKVQVLRWHKKLAQIVGELSRAIGREKLSGVDLLVWAHVLAEISVDMQNFGGKTREREKEDESRAH